MKRHKISKSIIILFCQQISSLLTVGVPLLAALKTFAQHLPDRRSADQFKLMIGSLEHGSSFGETLAKTGAFPDDLLRLVQASEPIGRVDLALEQAAQSWEEKNSLTQQILFSLLYPGLIMAGSLALVIFWLTCLLPTFQQVFTQIGVDLPPVTRFLLAMSRLLQNYGLYLLVVFSLMIITPVVCWRTAKGRHQLSLFIWRIGPARKIIQQTIQARLAQTLANLLKSGLPLLPALQIARQSVSFYPAREKLLWAIKYLQQGQSLTSSFKRTGIFSPFFLLALGASEDSGRLPEVLDRLGRQSQDQVRRSTRLFAALLEPAATILTGLLVAVVIISIFLPLIKLSGSIQ